MNMMVDIVMADASRRIRAPMAILAFQSVDMFLRKFPDGIFGEGNGCNKYS